MKNRAPLLAALVLALGAGCVHGGGINSTEGWNVYTTKHVRMYSPTSYRVPETLRALELQYAILSSSFFKGVNEPIEVLLVENTDFHDLFGNKRGSAAVASVPGSEIGSKGLVIVQPIGEGERNQTSETGSTHLKNDAQIGFTSLDNNIGGASQESVFEAVAHVFIHRAFPKAPLWFHEGFSTWTRNTTIIQDNTGRSVGCFGRPAYSDHTHVPLQQLLSMSWQQYDSPEGRGWYKHTAQNFIDYLFFAEGGKRRAALTPLVSAVAEGRSSDEIIKAGLPDLPMDQLNTAVLEHAKELQTQAKAKGDPRGRCPVPMAIMPDREPDLEEPKQEPVDGMKMKAVVAGLQKLPKHSEAYPPWFPPEVIEKGPAPVAAK